jgi:hypothetical protein
VPLAYLAIGVVLFAVGLASLLRPRRVIDLALRVELVEYRNTDGVEPRDWYVRHTRTMGLASALVGGYVAVAELLYQVG